MCGGVSVWGGKGKECRTSISEVRYQRTATTEKFPPLYLLPRLGILFPGSRANGKKEEKCRSVCLISLRLLLTATARVFW